MGFKNDSFIVFLLFKRYMRRLRCLSRRRDHPRRQPQASGGRLWCRSCIVAACAERGNAKILKYLVYWLFHIVFFLSLTKPRGLICVFNGAWRCANKSSGGLRPPQQPIMPIYSLCSTWCCGGRRPPLLFLPSLQRFAIVLRTPSDRIPFAVRLDCVRCPIRFRSVYDDISPRFGRLSFTLSTAHSPLLAYLKPTTYALMY